MKVSIVGNGFMGRKHLSVLENFENIDSVTIVDCLSTEKKSFRSVEEFIKSKTVSDLVVISTPNYLHYPQAKILLENGYHILIDKPLCFTSEQTTDLKKIQEKSGKKIFLVLQNRYSSISEMLKNLIDSGKLGKLYNIQLNAFWNRGEKYYTPNSWKGKKELDGGILYTQFSHLVDLILYLTGEKIKVKFSDFENFRNRKLTEIEDTAIAILETESGTRIVLNMTVSAFEKNEETSMNIIAEKGTIKIAGQYFNEIVYQNIETIPSVISVEPTTNEVHLKKMYSEIFRNLGGFPNNATVLEDGIPLITLLENIYAKNYD